MDKTKTPADALNRMLIVAFIAVGFLVLYVAT